MLNEEILQRFTSTFDAAVAAGESEPTAMVLATVDGDENLATRTVLLKGVDERGFTFYTNTLSIKGRHLGRVPRASATFLWKSAQSQVHVSGPVERVSEAEADAYFASRDRGSQIGAWASRQSQPLESRELLEQRVAEFEARFEGKEVARPPHWSGYRIVPEMVEFWHGQAARLHDRFRYELQDGAWLMQRLYP